jgi:copper ion binding protein
MSATTHQGNHLSFPIEGMTCASCVRRVENAIVAVTRVTRASVNLATERADVTFAGDPDHQAVIAAIKSAGYSVATQSIEVGIDGMTCASCVRRVEKAIAGLPGVLSAAVNLATEKATVEVMIGIAGQADV